jgi:hypothetical protein
VGPQVWHAGNGRDSRPERAGDGPVIFPHFAASSLVGMTADGRSSDPELSGPQMRA